MGLFFISDIKRLCLGAEDVKVVYIGSEQVWPVGSLPEWIEFADPEVLRVLLANGVDTDGDGGITEEEAAAVTSIGSWFDKNSTIQFFNEFKKFIKVTSLIASSNMTINGANAFSKCTSLQEITLPSSLTRIGSFAFSGCSSLEKINIGEHITYIGSNAFENCANIKNELFMPNLTTLGRCAFKGSGIVSFESMFSGDIDGVDSAVGGTFSDCVYLEKVIIPNVGNIQPRAFYNATNLKELDITNVKNIHQNAFRGCTSLNVDLNLPNLTTVGYYAFIGTKIKSLNAPKLVIISGVDNTIGGAFANIKELVSLNIPSIKSIGPRAFWGCSGLIQISGMGNVVTIERNAFNDCTSLSIEDLSLPNLETLGQNAFYGVKIKKISNLGKITALPAATTSSQNFGDKSVLEEAVLPETLTNIPNDSFYQYTNCVIEDLNLPNLTTLGGGAFNGTKLRRITSLGSVTQLAANTSSTNSIFYNCTELTHIEQSVLDKLTFIATAFVGCSNLEIEELKLPSLEGTITPGFVRCNKIKRVTDLGNITSYFEDRALYLATLPFGENVELIVIPKSVQSIGRYGFANSNNTLKTIIVNPTTPPQCAAYWATGMPSDTIFYVPDASVEVYKTASGWVDYADRIKPISQLATDNTTLYEEIKDYL